MRLSCFGLLLCTIVLALSLPLRASAEPARPKCTHAVGMAQYPKPGTKDAALNSRLFFQINDYQNCTEWQEQKIVLTNLKREPVAGDTSVIRTTSSPPSLLFVFKPKQPLGINANYEMSLKLPLRGGGVKGFSVIFKTKVIEAEPRQPVASFTYTMARYHATNHTCAYTISIIGDDIQTGELIHVLPSPGLKHKDNTEVIFGSVAHSALVAKKSNIGSQWNQADSCTKEKLCLQLAIERVDGTRRNMPPFCTTPEVYTPPAPKVGCQLLPGPSARPLWWALLLLWLVWGAWTCATRLPPKEGNT